MLKIKIIGSDNHKIDELRRATYVLEIMKAKVKRLTKQLEAKGVEIK